MPSINDIRRKLANIDVTGAAVEAIELSEPEILREQRIQLLEGKKANGQPIGKYRSLKYAAKKAQQNPLAGFGNVDLNLTGAFQSAVFLSVTSTSFIFESPDEKTAMLIGKYGDPFGLSYASRVIVINERLRKEFIFIIQNQLRK